MMEKHLPYFSLLEGCSSSKCPVCFIVKKNSDRYLETLIYEGINDSGFRINFKKNFGFCPVHTWQFQELKDSLATAILFKDLLSLEPESLLKKNKTCQICNLIKDTEDRIYAEMKLRLEDLEFKNLFVKSSGLCFYHYAKFALKIKNKLPQWFKDFHNKKIEELITETDRYIKTEDSTIDQFSVSVVEKVKGLKNYIAIY